MQSILSDFKDRMMEKYGSLSDEYTEQFKRLEYKHLSSIEQISRILEHYEVQKEEFALIKTE